MIFLLFYQAESWFMVGLVGPLFWTLLDLLMPGFFRFTLRGRFRQVLETRFGIERWPSAWIICATSRLVDVLRGLCISVDYNLSPL